MLEIINQTGRVILGQFVPRARLGLHLRLSQWRDGINRALEAGNTEESTRLISAYFSACGLDTAGRSGVECLIAYCELLYLNRLVTLLPFQKWQAPPVDEIIPYDYDGRTWIWWIHKIATRYGWTRHYILDELFPEEAAAYIQEILLSEYHEHETARGLSEVAYKYDPQIKKSRFIPSPKPGWMQAQREEKTYRISRKFIPVGNVINLDEMVH